MEGFMRSSSYFKIIRRFLWIVAICFLETSCIPDIGVSGVGSDPNAGEQYCKTDCQSDLEGCMESADGEKDEEQECKDDKNTCDKKCADWSVGFQGDEDASIMNKLFGRKKYWSDQQSRYATERLDLAVCRFDCNEAEKVCFESISEVEDANTRKLQCEEAKNVCFQQCEVN
jgi:hypothetical protein